MNLIIGYKCMMILLKVVNIIKIQWKNKYHCSILYNFLNKKYEIICIVIFAFLEKESNIESSYTYTIYKFNKYYKNLGNNVLSKKRNRRYT